jgi:capsular exopolysaccharide synthesis family protein
MRSTHRLFVESSADTMSPQSEMHKLDELNLMEEAASSIKLNLRQISIEPDQHSRVVFLTDEYGLAVERYKLLRRKLCALSPQGGLLLVTSPSSGDGKTLTSINLAWCLADGGHETCLVDLDFRAPSLADSLGYEVSADGLVEVLAGTANISDVMRKVEGRPLYVLGNREAVKSPDRQLAPATLRPLLKRLRDAFAWVVIDMPPAIPMSDVAEVLPYVDGALMVVRSGKTTKSLITPTLEILGTKIWGVVLNDSLINVSAYYGYYGYGADRKRKK